MVEPRNTGPTTDLNGAAVPGLADLHIEIRRHDAVRFVGTSAQLQNEGLLDKDCTFPKFGSVEHWEEGDGFDYCLRRERPKSFKGSWVEVDNWSLLRTVTHRDRHDIDLLDLEDKSKELQAERHSLTPAGRREWGAFITRFINARHDDDFQAFKALIPGLIPPKRGRKAKVTSSGAAQ